MIAYAAARTPGLTGILVALGVVGGLAFLGVLVRGVEALLAWAVAPLGVAYAISLLVDGGGVDGAAPLVGAALLLAAELAAWSLDVSRPIRAERGVVRRRALALAALAGAGVVASAAVVAVAVAPAGSGLAWTTLGAAAAVGAVGATVAVLRRAS